MATYPGAIWTPPVEGATMAAAVPHLTVHGLEQDEILAIEQTLGANAQGAFATVKAYLDSLPQGELGYAQATAGASGISTTIVDLTGLSVTVTVGSSRRIKISGKIYIHAAAAPIATELVIREGSTTLNGGRVYHPATSQDVSQNATHIFTPSVGAHTYKLSAAASAPSANWTAAGTSPAYILVEDIGAA